MSSRGLQFRQMLPDEAHAIAALVRHAFEADVAPTYSIAGVREFMRYVTTEALLARQQAGHWVLAAFQPGGRARVAAGMVEVRRHQHITLLFVHPACQRQGIGRELVRRAVDHCRGGEPGLAELTVNAAPPAVAAYARLGFVVCGPEQTHHGITFIPMALNLAGAC